MKRKEDNSLRATVVLLYAIQLLHHFVFGK